jgi:hypothetical protein
MPLYQKTVVGFESKIKLWTSRSRKKLVPIIVALLGGQHDHHAQIDKTAPTSTSMTNTEIDITTI